MPTNSIKRSWRSIVSIALLLLLALLWIPFCKKDLISTNLLFVNEYYKTIVGMTVDVGKILFGFWLASIYFKNYQTQSFIKRIQLQWGEKINRLSQNILLLEKICSDADINVKELSEQIRDNDIGLCYLSELISNHEDRDKLEPLGSKAYEYKDNTHGYIKQILDAIESGEIICLRPFSDKTVENINLIKDSLPHI